MGKYDSLIKVHVALYNVYYDNILLPILKQKKK